MTHKVDHFFSLVVVSRTGTTSVLDTGVDRSVLISKVCIQPCIGSELDGRVIDPVVWNDNQWVSVHEC